jgi:HptB-dependent secretion and biofilm anti anti-sigma factor
MSTSLTVGTTRGDDGHLVLTAAGEIDLSNIDVFNQALTTATAEAAASGSRLTVDLTAVEYLDSAAINALYNLAEHIHLIANPVLMRSLTVSGLAELVTIELPPTETQ